MSPTRSDRRHTNLWSMSPPRMARIPNKQNPQPKTAQKAAPAFADAAFYFSLIHCLYLSAELLSAHFSLYFPGALSSRKTSPMSPSIHMLRSESSEGQKASAHITLKTMDRAKAFLNALLIAVRLSLIKLLHSIPYPCPETR